MGRAELIRNLNTETIREMLVESDYLDDPNRRCVAMCPWDIPKNIQVLKEQGYLDDDLLHKIFIDNICRVYNVEY